MVAVGNGPKSPRSPGSDRVGPGAVENCRRLEMELRVFVSSFHARALSSVRETTRVCVWNEEKTIARISNTRGDGAFAAPERCDGWSGCIDEPWSGPAESPSALSKCEWATGRRDGIATSEIFTRFI